MTYRPLPIGIDDFKKIREDDYYYIDKAELIKELLDKKGEVNLFTRPRRFGKTLNLSMLRYFFEKSLEEGRSNKALFDGLKIMEAGEKYIQKQEQYPVIMLTLKSAKQPDWEMAYASMIDDIASEYARHNYVVDSEELLEADRQRFQRIRDRMGEPIEYAKALAFLSKCLEQYHKEKVIILIDEYDVPLENAYYAGFYDKMIAFIRSLFESALKTNPYLEFAVITGCLRISKESIFTGLNNLKIISILDKEYGEYFGFTEQEVREMLCFYQMEAKMDTMQSWYNGYLFGQSKVYNPWSVINYVRQLCADENAFPTAAWSNTSSNSIIKDMIYRADDSVRDEMELVMSGGRIEKKVHEDITYEDIYISEENLWNFLFFTGYLKQTAMRLEGVNRYVTMAIPNNEIFYIYENTIENWFRDKVQRQDLSLLYSAMLDGKVELFQEELGQQLQNTISFMDSQEAFYHGFLLGILANLKGYKIKSNREAGNGRYDICVRTNDLRQIPMILELKVAKKYRELDANAEAALLQIREKDYDAVLEEEGYEEAVHYGIAFFRKQVRIKMERTRIG